MKIGTEKLAEEQQTSEQGVRFAALVNGKRQGIIVGVKEPSRGFGHWLLEGDGFKKTFPNSDEAVFAAAEKNGRKISEEDKKKIRKSKNK